MSKTRCDYCHKRARGWYRYQGYNRAYVRKNGRVVVEVAACEDHQHTLTYWQEKHPGGKLFKTM